jgi:hypothetical protein
MRTLAYVALVIVALAIACLVFSNGVVDIIDRILERRDQH